MDIRKFLACQPWICRAEYSEERGNLFEGFATLSLPHSNQEVLYFSSSSSQTETTGAFVFLNSKYSL